MSASQHFTTDLLCSLNMCSTVNVNRITDVMPVIQANFNNPFFLFSDRNSSVLQDRELKSIRYHVVLLASITIECGVLSLCAVFSLCLHDTLNISSYELTKKHNTIAARIRCQRQNQILSNKTVWLRKTILLPEKVRYRAINRAEVVLM